MKRTLKILIALYAIILLSGCSETPTIYNSDNYKGEPIRIADNIYLKKVYIQGIYALLQCDKDGNITHNQNTNTGYQAGKVFVNTAIVTPTEETTDTFTFKCSKIEDCYNQIIIVKNALKVQSSLSQSKGQ